MKIKLLLAYDGTDFQGWQRQKSGVPTLQSHLENTLSRIFNSPIVVAGSGRTDSGVHALGQVAHFHVPGASRFPLNKLVWTLNKMLPSAVSVRGAWEAPADFHAMASAAGKIYRYRIWNSPVPHPVLRRYTLWQAWPLDFEKLQACAKYFQGKHDFKSFQTTGSSVKTTMRELYSTQWEKRGNQLFFHIHGSGFLRQMVRNIVGLQLDLLRQNRSPEEIPQVLAACDRRAAGSTAPAQGLFLMKVLYPRDLDNQCRKL